MHRATRQTIIIFLSAAVASFAACARPSAEAGRDTAAAATVNGKNVMLNEVDKIINQQFQGQQSQMSPLELAQARLQVLDTLIQKEVLFQRAEKEKLLPSDDEITQFINTQMQQSQMTQEEFQKRLKETNQTPESLREESRKALAIQKLQDRVNGKIVAPNDKEVEDFYNANKQQFVNSRGVRLASVMVDPLDNGAQDDAKSEAEAKQKTDLIYQQLRNGADFATVARARSEDPSNARGGDIGFATEQDLQQNGFPAQLINEFFGPMQVGSFTEPIQFPSKRWYIFKLQDKQLQNENLTLDSPGVRQQITEALLNQRKQIINAALVVVAMNEAKVVNNLANNMLNSPKDLSGLRPAPQTQQTTATPAAGANATPSPAATTTTTPTAAASPRD